MESFIRLLLKKRLNAVTDLYKVGIVVGIASLAVLTPFFTLSAYLQHESEFAQLFVDGDKQFQLMKVRVIQKFLRQIP